MVLPNPKQRHDRKSYAISKQASEFGVVVSSGLVWVVTAKDSAKNVQLPVPFGMLHPFGLPARDFLEKQIGVTQSWTRCAGTPGTPPGGWLLFYGRGPGITVACTNRGTSNSALHYRRGLAWHGTAARHASPNNRYLVNEAAAAGGGAPPIAKAAGWARSASSSIFFSSPSSLFILP